MSSLSLDRRGFLKGAVLAPLIGAATAAGPYQPTQVAALKGSARSVVIPTHEFAGELDERLDFPGNWEINVMHMRGHDAPVLTPAQIARDLSKPIGTKPLRELAAGKKKVVVTFDDLTRTTPTYTVTPWVISELKAAGVEDDSILFLASFGTHRAMTMAEVQKKLGKDIATRYAWVNHNCWSNVKEVGTTSFKNRVRLNQTFLDADLKVCLSGIKVHQDAGYGGGAKAVLPGVAWIETVAHNHNVILRNTRTAGPVRIFKNEVRLDMIEGARMAQVDFSVQIIYNQKLKPTHVFSGDIVDAHHAGVRVAAKHYCTPTFKDADIVVTNGYPQNAQAFHSQRWIYRSLKPGGTGVLIISHPLGLDPIHFLNNRAVGLDGSSYFQQLERRRRQVRPTGGSALILYSPYLDKQQMNMYGPGTHFATEWAEVIKILRSRHPGEARVAVYPYGGMQHQELELDG